MAVINKIVLYTWNLLREYQSEVFSPHTHTATDKGTM